MDKELVFEVKKKREFSELPDSIVEKALVICKENVKETRAYLRKYFSVFMTNKVVKGKDEKVLQSHISSKKRDYYLLYKRLLEGKHFKSVVDLGAGANGFSYPSIKNYLGEVHYFGIEATKKIVDNTNEYFGLNGFSKAQSIWLDLFELEKVLEEVNKSEKPRVIFIFQTIDALESIERNYSKKLLIALKENIGEEDRIVISSSLKSISGKQMFHVKRHWLEEFLEENFQIADSFEMFDEEYVVLKI